MKLTESQLIGLIYLLKKDIEYLQQHPDTEMANKFLKQDGEILKVIQKELYDA